MRQTIHIFKKDIRQLLPQIALVLTSAAVFCWNEIRGLSRGVNSGWAEFLFVVAAVFLIAMLIHAEAIPGDRQYWLTRPYAWKSLSGAKLLFVFAFIHLPVFLVQLAVLMAAGFPLGATLPGLLWSQVLLAICMVLPIGALASITARLSTFLYALSSAILIDQGISAVFRRSAQPWLGAVDWVRWTLVALGLIIIAGAVLYVQYKQRATWFSLRFAASGAIVMSAAYLFLSWPMAFAVQYRLSKPYEGSALEFSLAPRPDPGPPSGFRHQQVEVRFPISIRGIPNGSDLQANALELRFQSPGGREWKAALRPLADLLRSPNGQPAILNENIFVDRGFFNEERDRPLTVHASLYLTLFGKERTRTIPLQTEPVNVTDRMRCFTIPANIGWDVYCRSAFRWPADAVYAQIGNVQSSPFTKFISFSPFPANLSLSPLELHWAPVYPYGPAAQPTEVTIIAKRPLAHFRRDFEFRGVRLADLAIPRQMRTVVRNKAYRLEPEF